MSNKIVLLDGAMGTRLWEKSGDSRPVWLYNLENPDIVLQAHREYVEVGSEILAANTFSANRPSVMQVCDYPVSDVVAEGVRLAKAAAEGHAKVALDIGPLPSLLRPYGLLSEEEASEIFSEQLSAGMAEQPDLILFETFFDLSMLTLAVRAAKKYDVPVFASMSFEKRGRTMMGNRVPDVINALSPLGVSALGLNCSLGAEAAVPVIQDFHESTPIPLLFKPNAGVSASVGSEMQYESAEAFASACLPAAELGVTYLGGCCGSTPAHIAALKAALQR